MYLRRRNFTEAIHYLNKAIEGNRDFARAYLQRGICYFEIDETQKGCEDFKKVYELTGDYYYFELMKCGKVSKAGE